MAIKGARSEDGRLTPHLIVRGAAEAVEFYQRAFGARELYQSPLPGGGGLHVHLQIERSMIMLTEEAPGHPDVKLASPVTLGGVSSLVEIFVKDVDTAYARAVDAGAVPTLPLADTFWGDRYGWVTDPFGHIWALATAKEELTPEQVHTRMMALVAEGRPEA